MSSINSIGIFGGTFDPIHFGHLRAALEVYQALKLDVLRLIPCKIPPHRVVPSAKASDRLQMVSLAVQNSVLEIDDREMKREGPSYSVDTLLSLRQEFPSTCLCMIMGLDAFLNLSSWFQWEKLIQLSNIIIMQRTGWILPETGEMIDFLKQYRLPAMQSIQNFSYGKIVVQPIQSLNIQASGIRSMIASGESPQFLLPEKVLEYIRVQRLYEYREPNVHQGVL